MISAKGLWAVVKHSRWYSSDMTVFSCLVCFLYALGNSGNVVNGLVAFVGILLAHMATNLFDDYVDYKELIKDPRFEEFAPSVKCSYLRDGTSTMNDLLFVISAYCFVALVAGLFLFFRVGFPVIILALIGGIIVLSYPQFSKRGLSEVAVGIAFGPLLFEGMYFVMTKSFSLAVLVLGLAIVMPIIGVMYVHTILDYESDKLAGKKTLVQKLGSKGTAMSGFKVIYSLGFLFMVIFSIITKNYLCLFSVATIFFVTALYNSLSAYNSVAYYSRNEEYLKVLVGAVKVSSLFSFFLASAIFVQTLLKSF